MGYICVHGFQMQANLLISCASFVHLAAMLQSKCDCQCACADILQEDARCKIKDKAEAKAGFGQKGDGTQLPVSPNSHSDRLSTPAKPNSADPMWREMLHTIHVAANQ